MLTPQQIKKIKVPKGYRVVLSDEIFNEEDRMHGVSGSNWTSGERGSTRLAYWDTPCGLPGFVCQYLICIRKRGSEYDTAVLQRKRRDELLGKEKLLDALIVAGIRRMPIWRLAKAALREK
jgi:hypothetical protein